MSEGKSNAPQPNPEAERLATNTEKLREKIKASFVTARDALRDTLESKIKAYNGAEKLAREAIITKNTQWLIDEYEKQYPAEFSGMNIEELQELDKRITEDLTDRIATIKAYIEKLVSENPGKHQEILNKLANAQSIENIVALSWALKYDTRYQEIAFLARWAVNSPTISPDAKTPQDIIKSRDQQKPEAFRIISENLEQSSHASKRDVALFALTNLSSKERIEFAHYHLEKSGQPLHKVIETLLSRPGLYSPSEIEAFLESAIKKHNIAPATVTQFRKSFLTDDKKQKMGEDYTAYHETMSTFQKQQFDATPGSGNVVRDAGSKELLKVAAQIWGGAVLATNVIGSAAVGAKGQKGLGKITGSLAGIAKNPWVWGSGGLLAVLGNKDGLEGIFNSTTDLEKASLIGQELTIHFEEPTMRRVLTSDRDLTAVSALRDYIDTQRTIKEASTGEPLAESSLTLEGFNYWLENHTDSKYQQIASAFTPILKSPLGSTERNSFKQIIKDFDGLRSYDADPHKFISKEILKQ
ncbi:hypothetical protein CVV38_01755 [Candidatus Peregrinibacteria bacterium HGW-Peregrinibacteria-1]|jgi:hypothetical protein|nr:MAG: hypothetical protein CVV38_01755 [Candidatus Peregrinibacteria bacterium HGW-Peregrinibacteria-1]